MHFGTLLLAASFSNPNSMSEQAGRLRAADDAVAKASANFQQAAYEFGLHLALGDPATARRQMQETWRLLTALRNTACPADLRKAVSGVGRSLTKSEDCQKQFDQIDGELAALAQRIDVAEARKHLAAAREALKKKELAKVQSESFALMDSVVGQLVDIPLVQWVDGLRKARSILGDTLSRDRMAQALEVLRGLKGVEWFRPKAYENSLRLADELIASAEDLYTEGDFRNAEEVLRRVEVPFKIVGRASGSDETVSTIAELWRQLVKANELIISDRDLARTERDEGFALLSKVRTAIYEMQKHDGIR